MKDIFKIVKLYIIKYVWVIFLVLFAIICVTLNTTNSTLNDVKKGVLTYQYNKEYATKLDEKLIGANEEERLSLIEEDFEKEKEYLKKEDVKLTAEDFSKIKENNALMIYLLKSPVEYKSSLYHNYNTTNNLEKAQSLEKYINDEQKKYAKEWRNIPAVRSGSLTKEEINKWKKLKNIYPNYKISSSVELSTLALENLDVSSDKLEIKETLNNTTRNALYMLIAVCLVVVIFAMEYHTTFGKFIATIPFSKQKIYFGKLLTTIIIWLVSYLVVFITNLLLFRNSALGELFSVKELFFAQGKIFILGISLILLGAIFASFCGSVISVFAMYIPTLLFIYYPIAVMTLYAGTLGRNLIISGLNDSHAFLIPVRYYLEYVDSKYIIGYFVILIVLTLLTSKLYTYHNVEWEGKFYTYKIANYIFYVVALFGIVAILSYTFSKMFALSGILILVLTFLVVTPLLYLTFRLKLRV